jgi:hypothetical protein
MISLKPAMISLNPYNQQRNPCYDPCEHGGIHPSQAKLCGSASSCPPPALQMAAHCPMFASLNVLVSTVAFIPLMFLEFFCVLPLAACRWPHTV